MLASFMSVAGVGVTYERNSEVSFASLSPTSATLTKPKSMSGTLFGNNVVFGVFVLDVCDNGQRFVDR